MADLEKLRRLGFVVEEPDEGMTTITFVSEARIEAVKGNLRTGGVSDGCGWQPKDCHRADQWDERQQED